MKTVILAEKPSQAKAYADSFSKATRKDGYFEIQDRLFSGDVIRYQMALHRIQPIQVQVRIQVLAPKRYQAVRL